MGMKEEDSTVNIAHEVTDVEGADWRKPSSCYNSECVEVAKIGNTIGVRDSRYPEDGHLVLSDSEFAGFIALVKTGEVLFRFSNLQPFGPAETAK